MDDYRKEVLSDARDTALNFLDNIARAILDDGKASDDLLNDYPNGDSYHHETHTDKYYNPSEAVEVMECLDEYEETDSGLWDGLNDWRQELSARAAYTYANAVYIFWQKLIEDINDDISNFELAYEEDGLTVTDDCEKRLMSYLEDFIKRWDY